MRIALGIEYCGTGLHGFQAQMALPTVQGLLEKALGKVANEEIFLNCAGRTDANVHATGQVVHFDTRAKRHIDAWIWGTNANLPDAIRVKWAKAVDYHFHARFKATSRRYRYIIYNHPIKSAVLNGKVTWHYYALDENKMRLAADYLLGEHNFNSFRSAHCNAKTPTRVISDFHIERRGQFIVFEVEANAFLHHMVRNIAGVLLKIGSGLKPPEWMETVLAAQDRRAAAETAAPDGLYLIAVKYPAPYHFPTSDSVFLV